MSDVSNIIKKIQSDILDPQVPLTSILLKAKVLAYYLNNDELKKWVKNELDGYPDTDNLPEYRIVASPLVGTFTNGAYIHSNKIISLLSVPPQLRDSAGKVHHPHGISGLEEMSNHKSLQNPMSGDWVDMYNVFNADTLRHGHYQLVEAYHPIMGSSMVQILGAVRSRLQDFVLEISSLSWDMTSEPPPVEKINRIFQLTIQNNSGEINMSDFQKSGGDEYNVGQAGAVGKYARSDGNTFIQSEEKRTLAEAAEEIQNLLKQLEQTNPTATQSDMIAYVNDETTPSLKRRTVAAVKACGEAAIDEFVLENKFLRVAKAAIKGWLESGS